MRQPTTRTMLALAVVAALAGLTYACRGGGEQTGGAVAGDAAQAVYVAPGDHDEFYAFFSGGFSGNLTVHGLPSGRLIKTVPVFSQFPENGWGYSEET